MTGQTTPELVRLHDGGDEHQALVADVAAGLTAQPRRLPPKWLYDERGSQLFDEITRQPEYYLPDAETAALERVAGEIVDTVGAVELVEVGSGSSRKTRVLLDALSARRPDATYVGFDVSESAVSEAIDALAAAYPGLRVVGVVGDFHRHLGEVPRSGRRLVALLGSTIGNMVPAEQAALLRRLRGMLADGDGLLLGVDLVKDPAVLEAAYRDAAGVTDAFTANMLTVLRRRLGADLEPDAFEPFARWRPEPAWVELGLRARRATTMRFPEPDLEVGFEPGEELHTEVSCKFTRDSLEARLSDAGLVTSRWAPDPEGRFAVVLATRT